MLQQILHLGDNLRTVSLAGQSLVAMTPQTVHTHALVAFDVRSASGCHGHPS
jgi:hypothetical protein